MELVQTRIVTDRVAVMARFYAALVGVPVALNDYYVEVATGSMSVGFSRCRFTEEQGRGGGCTSGVATSGGFAAASRLRARSGELILDFASADVDAEQERIDALGVAWVMPPTTQPWGKRSMLFRDPESHLVNVFSADEVRP
jgi:predicted enzyme related to lactoylglutathione lyase